MDPAVPLALGFVDADCNVVALSRVAAAAVRMGVPLVPTLRRTPWPRFDPK